MVKFERAYKSLFFGMRTKDFFLRAPLAAKRGNISLYFISELKIYHLSFSIQAHNAFDINDPGS